LVSKRKIKNEVKKAFRLPNNAVVMSMMAVILVCAAPALVSVIDDTVNEQYDMPLSPEFIDPRINSINMSLQGEPVEGTDLGIDIIREDNVITVLSSTPGYKGTLSTFVMDKAIVKDVSKIVITSSSEHSLLLIESGGHNISGTYDSDLGQYTFSLSSIEKHYIMQTASDDLAINVIDTPLSGNTFEAVETFTIEVYGSVMIPYAEIIIGATGALLLICALLATPWFSTSGITVKRRR